MTIVFACGCHSDGLPLATLLVPSPAPLATTCFLDSSVSRSKKYLFNIDTLSPEPSHLKIFLLRLPHLSKFVFKEFTKSCKGS